jgi:hypothetical protein
MDIRYQDTMGQTHSDLAFDYVGPFEERITLSEFFERGYQRQIYEDLKESFEEDKWVDGPDTGGFDPIDIADGKLFEAVSETDPEDFEGT